uniref:Uncharacterized protein n=1 Tax=Knipowitschia caucasica TaxID=637954 RepID=A0AAV2M5P9_KNICA
MNQQGSACVGHSRKSSSKPRPDDAALPLLVMGGCIPLICTCVVGGWVSAREECARCCMGEAMMFAPNVRLGWGGGDGGRNLWAYWAGLLGCWVLGRAMICTVMAATPGGAGTFMPLISQARRGGGKGAGGV